MPGLIYRLTFVDLPPPGRAPPCLGDARGDAGQPGAEFLRLPEHRQPLVGSQEDFLAHVVCVLKIARQGASQREDLSLIALNQGPIGVCIAAQRGADKLGVDDILIPVCIRGQVAWYPVTMLPDRAIPQTKNQKKSALNGTNDMGHGTAGSVILT